MFAYANGRLSIATRTLATRSFAGSCTLQLLESTLRSIVKMDAFVTRVPKEPRLRKEPEKPRQYQQMRIQDMRRVVSVDKVHSLNAQLQLLVDSTNDEAIAKLLRQLQRLFVPLETLEETSVGKTVFRFRSHPSSDIVALADGLYRKWKQDAKDALLRRQRRTALGFEAGFGHGPELRKQRSSNGKALQSTPKVATASSVIRQSSDGVHVEALSSAGLNGDEYDIEADVSEWDAAAEAGAAARARADGGTVVGQTHRRRSSDDATAGSSSSLLPAAMHAGVKRHRSSGDALQDAAADAGELEGDEFDGDADRDADSSALDGVHVFDEDGDGGVCIDISESNGNDVVNEHRPHGSGGSGRHEHGDQHLQKRQAPAATTSSSSYSSGHVQSEPVSARSTFARNAADASASSAAALAAPDRVRERNGLASAAGQGYARSTSSAAERSNQQSAQSRHHHLHRHHDQGQQRGSSSVGGGVVQSSRQQQPVPAPLDTRAYLPPPPPPPPWSTSRSRSGSSSANGLPAGSAGKTAPTVKTDIDLV